MSLATLFSARRDELRQALRVTIGTALAFAAYKLLGLQQGYWAVFTVIIVMQGSIGGTLGLAVDRMIGTIVGALLGGAAVMIFPHTVAGLALALVTVTAITALAAAWRPQFRTAPVTGAILLLSQHMDLTTATVVLDRIIEIAIGGVIGVGTSVLVFPAPSRSIVLARTETVLASLSQLLRLQADAVAEGSPLAFSDQHAATRKTLANVEQAMVDAERERVSRLTRNRVPDAIPRTLWRIRNGVAQVTRALDVPLAGGATVLQPAVAAQMRADADFLDRCATALHDGTRVDREAVEREHAVFDEAFSGLRGSGVIRALDFDGAARVFGVAFTFDRLHQDLRDLADRIDELVK